MMLFMRIKFAHLSKTQKSKYVKNERLMFLQVRKFIHYAEVDIKTGSQKLQEIFYERVAGKYQKTSRSRADVLFYIILET